MKNVIYMIGFLMASGLACMSCQDDQNEPVVTGSNSAAVRVVFETPDYVQLGTRVTAESNIKDVTILQYKVGKLLKKVFLEDKLFSQPVELKGDIALDGIPATTLDDEGKMVQNGTENVTVFLVNVKAVTGSGVTLEDNSSYNDFLSYTVSLTDAAALGGLQYMPMSGFYYGGITAGITTQINVSLKRALAKVSFTLNLDNFMVEGKKVVTTVNSISLHNVPKKITFFNTNRPALPVNGKPGEWPANQEPYPTPGEVLGTDDNETGALADDAGNFCTLNATYNQTTTDKLKSFVAYVPENARGSYTSITSNKDKTPAKVEEAGGSSIGLTYILVDLDYETDEGVIEQATYKIYLGGDANGDMNLLANVQYNVTTYLYGANTADTRITVTSIFNPAPKDESTLKNAILPLANSYIINPSNYSSETVVLPLIQARNGWRYIHATLKAEGDEIDYIGNFDTMIAGDWTIKTLWKTWSGTDINVTGALPGTGEVTTASSDTDRYYAKLSGLSTLPLGNNCVIALVSTADNKIWWTWHLWITDYNPDATGTKNGQTHKYFSEAFTSAGLYYNKRMMDRNLGATVTGVADNYEHVQPTSTIEAVKWYGLLYQWGRKDPFTNSTSGEAAMNATSPTPVYPSDNSTKYTYSSSASVGTDWQNAGIVADANSNSIDGFPKVTNGGVVKYRVIDAIRNPMHYYHSNGTANDWTKQDDKLWNMTIKTAFDPCPPGWRVPAGGGTAAYNPWAGFGTGLFNSTTNITYASTGYWKDNTVGPFPWFGTVSSQPGTAGRLYGATDATDANGGGYGPAADWYGGDNSKAWYPAAGLRNSASGAFGYTGSYGIYWSSAVTSANGYNLTFHSTHVNPTSNNHRAYGFPVRCVQRLQQTF
jgi:hypothetical protein